MSVAKPPKPPRLNVYVTPAGFFDAVVAAPNQKAALTAWGARANLFTEGLAAPETDPVWRERALARPGEVLRKPRGDPAALLTAPSPPRRAKPTPAPAGRTTTPKTTASRARPAPPAPDPGPLRAAEAALAKARATAGRERAALEARRRALETESDEAQARWSAEALRLEANVERARRAFREAGGDA